MSAGPLILSFIKKGAYPMAVLQLLIKSVRPATYYVSNFQTAGGNRQIANRIYDYVGRVFSGSEGAQSSSIPPTINVVCQDNSVRASGTFTLTSVIATDAISINGVTFTCVASGATGNQFNVGGTDTITATNLAAAINASVTALVSGYVTASSSVNVVTVTSAFYGPAGNQCTIVSADGTIVANHATLTGGAVDPNTLNLTF